MSDYQSDLHTTLYSDSTIQGLVSTYVKDSTTMYAIFNSPLIASDITTDTGIKNFDVSDTTINHYNVTPLDDSILLTDVVRSISCRAYTAQDAETLQTAVKDALNRKRVNDSFFVCSRLSIIPPADESDNFNAPVEVKILNKK